MSEITKRGMLQGDLIQHLADLTTAVNALRADHNTLVAKLNLDAGVTDVNYAVATTAAARVISAA